MNNSSGLYTYITEDYVVAGAKQALGLTDSTIYDLYLKDAVNLGLKELRNLGTQTPAVTQLQIENHRCSLPRGFIRFTKTNPIVYVDVEGRAINGTTSQDITVIAITAEGSDLGSTSIPSSSPVFRYSAPAFINNTFFKDSPYDQSFAVGGSVNIVNGYLYFSSDVTARFVTIAYMSSAVDDNGDLLIPSYTERALIAFACMRFCRTNFEKYSPVFPSYEIEWKRGKADCRGYAALPSSLEYSAINGIMKSLI
jgi:hypothetical protein